MDEPERHKLEAEAIRLKSVADARVKDFLETMQEFKENRTNATSYRLMTEAGRMQVAYFEYTPVLEELLKFYRKFFLEHQ